MSPQHRVACLLAAVSLLTGTPLGVSAQTRADSAYIAFQPIPNGPAEVFLDGQFVDTLGNREISKATSLGRHAVKVRKYGFADFDTTVSLDRRNDVLPLTVLLVPAKVTVIREEAAGRALQQLAPVRIAHLDPAIVPVTGPGLETRTPALLGLPVGRNTLTVNGRTLCIDVPAASRDTSFVLLRAGEFVESRALGICQTGAPAPFSPGATGAAPPPGPRKPTYSVPPRYLMTTDDSVTVYIAVVKDGRWQLDYADAPAGRSLPRRGFAPHYTEITEAMNRIDVSLSRDQGARDRWMYMYAVSASVMTCNAVIQTAAENYWRSVERTESTRLSVYLPNKKGRFEDRRMIQAIITDSIDIQAGTEPAVRHIERSIRMTAIGDPLKEKGGDRRFLPRAETRESIDVLPDGSCLSYRRVKTEFDTSDDRVSTIVAHRLP